MVITIRKVKATLEGLRSDEAKLQFLLRVASGPRLHSSAKGPLKRLLDQHLHRVTEHHLAASKAVLAAACFEQAGRYAQGAERLTRFGRPDLAGYLFHLGRMYSRAREAYTIARLPEQAEWMRRLSKHRKK